MKNFLFNLKLEKWHFFLLVVVLSNFGIGLISGYRLNQNLTFVLKVVLYLTGIILFLITLIPFRKTAIYYSFYAISVVVAGLFFLFGGILLATISSLILYPIFPKQTLYKNETIRIYDRFEGFMGRCCTYEVVEPKFYIFEKYLGYISIEKPIDADKDEFNYKNNTVIYRYELYNDGRTNTVRDTTEILNLK